MQPRRSQRLKISFALDFHAERTHSSTMSFNGAEFAGFSNADRDSHPNVDPDYVPNADSGSGAPADPDYISNADPDSGPGSNAGQDSVSDADSEEPCAEIVFSQKNRPMLSFEGYLYNFEKKVRK